MTRACCPQAGTMSVYWLSREIITSCQFEVPQNLGSLIKVYAINFTPSCRYWRRRDRLCPVRGSES